MPLLDFRMLLAADRSEPNCGKARSPLCLWQTAALPRLAKRVTKDCLYNGRTAAQNYEHSE
jgi:hypothetical protein